MGRYMKITSTGDMRFAPSIAPISISLAKFGKLTIPEDITALESAHLTQLLFGAVHNTWADIDSYVTENKLERLFKKD
jgi:hypothetical protein